MGACVIEKWPELRNLTVKQVLDGAARCAGEEREALLKFLLYLSEVERREAYECAPFKKRSLWEYLEQSLGFTVCETRLRYHSARLLLRFPIVAEYLADGRLSMTTLVVMKDHLTQANVRSECDKASGKSKADVEKQVAEKIPPVLDFGMITPGPAATITKAAPDAIPAPGLSDAAVAAPVVVPSAPGNVFVVQNAPSKASVKALTAKQDILSMTLQAEDRAILEELRDLLSESVPDRDVRKVVLHCLTEVRTRILKQRGVIPVRPRTKKTVVNPASSSAPTESLPAKPEDPKPYKLPHVVIPVDAAIAGRHRDRQFTREAIPALTERMVWIRDNHRCQRKLKGGGICGSTYRCQLDHIKAVADGGTNDPDNLQVHCRRHNLQRARERFGRERIERAIRLRRGTGRAVEAATTAGILENVTSLATRSKGRG